MIDSYEIELPSETAASSNARRLLEQWFSSSLEPAELHTAKLLTTELVTNALLHGRGTITLRAGLDDNQLLVEVIDQGDGFEPPRARPDIRRGGGWGLRIVQAESTRWGVFEGTTHVWFALNRGETR